MKKGKPRFGRDEIEISADIFEDLPPCLTEDSKSDMENIFDQLSNISQAIYEANSRLYSLRKLFKVSRQGDDFDRSYKLLFNDMNETTSDYIAEKIYEEFVKDYSLDISEINNDIKILYHHVDAILSRGKPPYCEVDLLDMTEKKEPVEC